MSIAQDQTVPFYKVKAQDRNRAISNMRTYTNNDREKLTVEHVKTAFKALCGAPGSMICGVPISVQGQFGPTFRIPIKGSPIPAFTSLAQLKAML